MILWLFLIMCDIFSVTTEDIHQSSKAEISWDAPPPRKYWQRWMFIMITYQENEGPPAVITVVCTHAQATKRRKMEQWFMVERATTSEETVKGVWLALRCWLLLLRTSQQVSILSFYYVPFHSMLIYNMYIGAVYSSVSCWMLVGWMFFVWDGGFNVLIVFSEKDLAENCETLLLCRCFFLCSQSMLENK